MISGYPHFRKPQDFRLFKVWGSYLLSLWTANLFCGLHSPVIDQNPANLSSGFGVYSRAFPHEFPNSMTITGLCWFISHFGWLLHVMCFQVLLGAQRFIILMHFFGPQPISWAQVRMLHGPTSIMGRLFMGISIPLKMEIHLLMIILYPNIWFNDYKL